MNAIDIVLDLAQRPIDALDLFWDRLDPAELNAHPGGHDNSPAWLLWHTGRGIDVQVAHLAGHEQNWTAAGFREQFALDLAERDMGYGHSSAQARAVVLAETAESKQPPARLSGRGDRPGQGLRTRAVRGRPGRGDR